MWPRFPIQPWSGEQVLEALVGMSRPSSAASTPCGCASAFPEPDTDVVAGLVDGHPAVFADCVGRWVPEGCGG